MAEHNVNNPKMENNEDVIDLGVLFRDFLSIARRIWWLFLLLIGIGVGGTALFSYIGYTPMYVCQATFTVGTNVSDSGSYGFTYSMSTAAQLSKTFPYILNSSYFNNRLLEEMGIDKLNGNLTATTIEDSNMVTMKATSPSPIDAKAILETALAVYPDAARFILGDMQFHVIDDITIPTEPYNEPNLKRILVYGGGAGLLLACAIAVVLAMMRKTVKTPEEMEAVSNLECLAALPEVKAKIRKQQNKRHISVFDKRIPYAYTESMRALQIRVDVAMEKREGKVLMVTSTTSGEGKSTVAVNLAQMLGSQGKRVVLVDCDFQKQNDAVILGCGDGVSLADAIQDSEQNDTRSTIRRLKGKGIWFCGGTRPAKNSAQLLSSAGTRHAIDRIREQVDYVIIDTPPCGIIQDAAILANYADAILFVIQYDCAPKREIVEALGVLEGKNAPVLGYVLNAYPQSSLENSSSYGKYGYGRYGYGKYGYSRYGYGKYGYGRYGSNESSEEET